MKKSSFYGSLSMLGILALSLLSPSVRQWLTSSAFAGILSPRLLPIADGIYKNWKTTSPTSTHFETVDESWCNGNLDYIYTTNTSPSLNQDSFKLNLSSIPNGNYITKIKIQPCASAYLPNASSTLSIFFYQPNQIIQAAWAANYVTSGTLPYLLATTTFSNLALQKTSSTQIEPGVVLTGGTGGAKVSQLATTMEYVAPTTTGMILPYVDGTYKQWFAPTSTHVNNVNEGTCNTSTYVYGTTNQRDSYGISLNGLPATSIIVGVELFPCAAIGAASDPGEVNPTGLSVFYRFNGTNSADSATYVLPSGTSTDPIPLPSRTFSNLYLPYTSSSHLEIGAVVKSGFYGAKLSQIRARLTYIVP